MVTSFDGPAQTSLFDSPTHWNRIKSAQCQGILITGAWNITRGAHQQCMEPIALFHSPQRQRCFEFNLVLQAVNIESEVVFYEGRYYLLVDDRIAEQAYTQLRHYVEENQPEQRIARPLIPMKKGFTGAYLYAILLLIIGVFQVTGAFGLNWHDLGLADSWKIVGGEWWRAVTALTLHANSAHLAGNIGFGALFGILVSQHIGGAMAWMLILLAGTSGNLVNAYMYQNLHLSLGASTAVFGALGMLGIFALESRPSYRARGMRRALPFVATIALLAMTGSGGERTDLLAHLAGFGAGCVIGMLWLAVGKPRLQHRREQVAAYLLTLATVASAWGLAVSQSL